MKNYFFRPEIFLDDIKCGNFFKKDQWQFQMHIRALKKVGIENLHFFTTEITKDNLSMLSVNPHSIPPDRLIHSIQSEIDKMANSGKQIAVFPEGPYCSPA